MLTLFIFLETTILETSSYGRENRSQQESLEKKSAQKKKV